MSDTMNNEEYEDEDEDTVTITLEDGSEVNCDIIATFPIGDKDYIALLPDRVSIPVESTMSSPMT